MQASFESDLDAGTPPFPSEAGKPVSRFSLRVDMVRMEHVAMCQIDVICFGMFIRDCA